MRKKRAARSKTDYYYSREEQDNGEVRATKHRGKYFKTLRFERNSLHLLSRARPSFCGSRRERRNIRHIYYNILPKLFLLLWWGPDRDLLHEVESIYYTWLNITRLSSGNEHEADRLDCRFYPLIPNGH